MTARPTPDAQCPVPGSLAEGPGEGIIEVTVWDLEMTDPALVGELPAPDAAVTVMAAGRPAPELARFFYELVGGPWNWVDRLVWSRDQWLQWVDRPEHHLVTAWSDGVPAGYYELEQQAPSSVEMVYFGLAPDFIGRGLGRWLLTEGLRRAWSLPGTERVWLHTCSLDGPAALANYQARGFTVVAEHIEWRVAVEPTTA